MNLTAVRNVKKSIHLYVFFIFPTCVLQLMMESYLVATDTSCKSHYAAGRTSSGTYYLSVSGYTFQVTLYPIYYNILVFP